MSRFCLLGGGIIGGKGRSREAWEETPKMSQARDGVAGHQAWVISAGRGEDILELLWMEE